jgi:XRE family transcriptional regulator, regulator of sulfur utilization
MQLHARLREIRQQRVNTLLQVAEATKLSVSYLSDLERGRTQPSLETLQKLALHYEVTLTDLLTGVDVAGPQTLKALAPGLDALVEKRVIPEAIAADLNRIQLRGQRPRNEDEWHELYLYLKLLMKPYLAGEEPPKE